MRVTLHKDVFWLISRDRRLRCIPFMFSRQLLAHHNSPRVETRRTKPSKPPCPRHWCTWVNITTHTSDIDRVANTLWYLIYINLIIITSERTLFTVVSWATRSRFNRSRWCRMVDTSLSPCMIRSWDDNMIIFACKPQGNSTTLSAFYETSYQSAMHIVIQYG